MKERAEEVSWMLDSADIWMGTFHSICVKILRKFIDRIGFTSDFIIFDTSDQKSLMKDVLKKLNIDDKQYSDKGFYQKYQMQKMIC